MKPRAPWCLAAWLCLLTLVSGCGLAAESPGAAGPSTGGIQLVALAHSESDQAEEPGHIAQFLLRLLPGAMARGDTVLVYIAGSEGQTSPRVISRVNFDTSDVDGANPILRDDLQGQRRDQLTREIAEGTQRIPFSPATDVFGGCGRRGGVL